MMTNFAPVLISKLGIAIFAQHNHLPTVRAERWLICRRIFKLLKIVFISSIPNIHLCHERTPAEFAIFPVSRMLLGMMVTAKGKSIMVAMTTVPRIRKRYIFVFIVAYPVATAFSLYQVFRFPAEPAPKYWLFLYGFIFMLCSHFLFVLER